MTLVQSYILNSYKIESFFSLKHTIGQLESVETPVHCITKTVLPNIFARDSISRLILNHFNLNHIKYDLH